MPLKIARKLELKFVAPLCTLKYADASSSRPRGFILDLLVCIGHCLVSVDFYIVEMAGDANESLIFGSAFLNTVGACAHNDRGQISFKKIDKELFYPAVLYQPRVLMFF